MYSHNIDARTVNISFLIMAGIGVLGVLLVTITSNLTEFVGLFQGRSGAVVVIVLLAMASHNVMRGLREIRTATGLSGLETAVTKIVTPFAAAILGATLMGVTPWTLIGIAPLTAPFWAQTIRKLEKL